MHIHRKYMNFIGNREISPYATDVFRFEIERYVRFLNTHATNSFKKIIINNYKYVNYLFFLFFLFI